MSQQQSLSPVIVCTNKYHETPCVYKVCRRRTPSVNKKRMVLHEKEIREFKGAPEVEVGIIHYSAILLKQSS